MLADVVKLADTIDLGSIARAWGFKSLHPHQKIFHSRYNFGYGILLYMRKTLYFRPLTAHLGGFEGVFYRTDNIFCPDKTETADFVSFKDSIVQGINLQKNIVL